MLALTTAGQSRRILPLVLILFILFAVSLTDAAFTRSAFWKLDSIVETYAGTWCFHPGPNPMFASACANATLNALLKTHLRNSLGPGLSIAYYDPRDGSVLGGAGWTNWDAVVLPVGVCMSGRVDDLDNMFSTTCRFTVIDDDHNTPSAHAEECVINRPQLRVTDGCYTPPPHRPWFRLNDSASGILTIIGIILAIPVYGIYRSYRADRVQQHAGTEAGSALALVNLGGGVDGAAPDQDASRLEPAQA